MGTHCGLRGIEFNGGTWTIEGPLNDGNGNPPQGFGNPQDHGSVTLTSQDEGIYRSELGVERRVERASVTGTQPKEPACA
jgi:hypothetical protein